jgi:hypothetical protein
LGRDPENDQVIAHHLKHESLELLCKALIESEEFNERHIKQSLTKKSPSTTHLGDECPTLSPENVRQAYREILGREPEDAAAISHHRRAASTTALRDTLRNAEEFQAPLRVLPTHARSIFLRLHQLQQDTSECV